MENWTAGWDTIYCSEAMNNSGALSASPRISPYKYVFQVCVSIGSCGFCETLVESVLSFKAKTVDATLQKEAYNFTKLHHSQGREDLTRFLPLDEFKGDLTSGTVS